MKTIPGLRALCIFLLVLGTASCGFTPVYKAGSKTGAALSEIFVANPGNDRNRYLFVVEMEERVGRNLNGNLLLDYNILISQEAIGRFPVKRFHMIGKVDYKVISIKEDRLLFSGSQDGFVGFGPDEPLVNTVTKAARERLVSILADQVTTELIAQFSNPQFE
jgi:hypothetical protein